MNKRKLLLLGGSAQQIIAIKIAKELGYQTILCDYLPDNPGQFEADKFYLVSTTDKEAVLKVASEEKIDGIIGYASDPAAPTVAYVAEKLKLHGMPFEVVNTFVKKNMFLNFLKENGFNYPISTEIEADEENILFSEWKYPIIIKPSDSSGSKGVNLINSPMEFFSAKQDALQYSKSGLILAEEYIVRDHPDVIEAEILVVNGKVIVWGLMNSIRDPYTNPLIPAAYSCPLNIGKYREKIVKEEIQRLLSVSKIEDGAFNIEMSITKDDKLYIFDIGPRSGGNLLPEFIGYVKGRDIPSETISIAMGDYDSLSSIEVDESEDGFWGLSVLHASRNGVFRGVEYSEMARKYLFREQFRISKGELVNKYMTANDTLGYAFFKFESVVERDEIMNDFVGNHIKVLVD